MAIGKYFERFVLCWCSLNNFFMSSLTEIRGSEEFDLLKLWYFFSPQFKCLEESLFFFFFEIRYSSREALRRLSTYVCAYIRHTYVASMDVRSHRYTLSTRKKEHSLSSYCMNEHVRIRSIFQMCTVGTVCTRFIRFNERNECECGMKNL